jgi:hypothetical protein
LALAAAVAGIATTAILARTPSDLGARSMTPSPTPELTYSCGGNPFSPALFNEPELDLRSTPSGVALGDFIDSGQGGELMLPAGGWRLAELDDSSASFVAQLPGDPPYAHAEAQKKDGATWRIVSWGQCRPALEMPGMNAATWTIVPRQDINAETTTFLADVTETACASGRTSEERIVPPLIIYEPDRVIVTFTVEPLPGDQECPGNPATRISVRLSEPLGGRQLLDGGTLPFSDPRSDG